MTQGVTGGVDESWSHASPTVLKSLGYGFVARYLGPDPTKNLTPAERDQLHAAGLQIVLVFEGAGQSALGGFNQGLADAHEALAQANALGLPVTCPIFFAVDWGLQSPQVADVIAYFKAVALVLTARRTGVYGGYDTVRLVLDSGYAAWAWQTSAWSGGRWDTRAQLQQYGSGPVGGVTVDLDRATVPNFGGWGNAPVPSEDDEVPFLVHTSDGRVFLLGGTTRVYVPTPAVEQELIRTGVVDKGLVSPEYVGLFTDLPSVVALLSKVDADVLAEVEPAETGTTIDPVSLGDAVAVEVEKDISGKLA